MGGIAFIKPTPADFIKMGGSKATLEVYEPDFREDASGISLSAETEADGFLLNGTKLFVMDGSAGDMLIVAARTQETFRGGKFYE